MNTAVEVSRLVKKLNPAQLDAAAAFIADLLAGEDQEQDGAPAGEDRADQAAEPNGAGHAERGNGRKAAGHVELKMIGKAGPYAYLRYWEGKHLRSKYIGKVRNS